MSALTVRDEILGALACVQSALRSDHVQGHAVVQLTAAVAALTRANDRMRDINSTNVLPFPGHSVKVGGHHS